MTSADPPAQTPDALTTLVYEMLDAHGDTAALAADQEEEPWRAHLDYLRALQRKGRELLAAANVADQPGCAPRKLQ